jgi:hypothetical protein
MTWKEYYENYYEWSESTQRNNLSKITDFWPEGRKTDEIIDCMFNMEEKASASLLRKAIKAKVPFSSNDILEIFNIGLDNYRELLKELLIAYVDKFEWLDFESCMMCFDDEDSSDIFSRLKGKTLNFNSEEITCDAYGAFGLEAVNILMDCSNARFEEFDLAYIYDQGADEDVVRRKCEQSGISFRSMKSFSNRKRVESERKPGIFKKLMVILFAASDDDFL